MFGNMGMKITNGTPINLSLLLGWLLPNEVKVIEDFQIDYGYNQNIGIYERDYLDGIELDYDGIIFTDGVTEVVYFNQLDARWKDIMYGTSGTIGTSGCGPTALSIVVSSLSDRVSALCPLPVPRC